MGISAYKAEPDNTVRVSDLLEDIEHSLVSHKGCDQSYPIVYQVAAVTLC